jgi:ubiquinone/menaquinone biosynthesis C-methylase UbiE/uncharacterized protein YbaR (Trm112 family)
MKFQNIEICCPQCRGELERKCEEALDCIGCGRRFPVLLGIPDLRIFPDPYIGLEEDRAKGLRLAQRFDDFDFRGFVDHYYSITSAVPPHHAREYTRGIIAASPRAEAWLASCEATTDGSAGTGALLELGCGTAPLLAAARNYVQRVGVDIAFRWLVIAKKRLAEAGEDFPLICACAEALPFPDATFSRVAADSVIETLHDQSTALREVRRVLRPGGRVYIATPNRFSLGPDPHTKIWAGSWLPKSWTAAMVRRQGGVPPVRQLLSVFNLKRLLSATGFREIRVFLPGISAGQRAQFSLGIQWLMTAYNCARRLPIIHSLLYLVGPMLQAVAIRAEGSTQND